MKTTTMALTGVLAAAFVGTAMGQFSSDPGNQLVVSGGTGDQVLPHWQPFPSGGFWVWYSNQFGSGYQDWVTRINLDGTAPAGWTLPGEGYFPDTQSGTSFLPTADVDADGNLIIAYPNDAVSPAQVALQKIAPDGTKLFGAGITVTSGTQTANLQSICVDSDGNYVLAYTQNIGVLQLDGTTTLQKPRTFYQKFSPTGTAMWASPVMIEPNWTFWDTNLTGTQTAANQAHYKYGFQNIGIVKSDGGSTIVGMVSNNGTTGQRRMAVQKLSSSGALMWNGGLDVPISTANSMGNGVVPNFFADASGGAIVGWYDGGGAVFFRSRVQRVNSSGTLMFPANGAMTSTSTAQNQESPGFSYDPGTDEVYAITQENGPGASGSSTKGINIQKFDSAGNPQFGADLNGVVVVPLSPVATGGSPPGNVPQFCRLTLTGGGVIGGWFHAQDTSGSQQMDVQAAKVTNEGTLAWGPMVVNNTNSVAKGRLDMAPLPGGAGVVMFYQSGVAGTSDFIATRVNDDGTIGNPVSNGSCCTNNMCSITTQAACTGTWTANGTCTGPSSCAAHCGSADFNCDGDTGTDLDIEEFFACIAGNCPPLPCISNADFNGDGDVGTDADIEAFFRVLAGGNC